MPRNQHEELGKDVQVRGWCHSSPSPNPRIGRLSLEAEFRDVTIGELAGRLIIVVTKNNLFQRVLGKHHSLVDSNRLGGVVRTSFEQITDDGW